jgi:hypothetical protein
MLNLWEKRKLKMARRPHKPANATVHAGNAKTPETAEPVMGTGKELERQENKITNIHGPVRLHDRGPL